MIRILMLDLGDTLVDASHVALPGVHGALKTISSFKTASKDLLSRCIVSDYTLANPETDAEIARIFKEYVAMLTKAQLAGYFQPVKHHVTLSTHAGVYKPDRKVFEQALQRLGSAAKLDECLFITENEDHIKACQKLGMTTLHFGKDFTEWSKAPPLIKALL